MRDGLDFKAGSLKMGNKRTVKEVLAFAPVRCNSDNEDIAWIDISKVSGCKEFITRLLAQERRDSPTYYEENPVIRIAQIRLSEYVI